MIKQKKSKLESSFSCLDFLFIVMKILSYFNEFPSNASIFSSPSPIFSFQIASISKTFRNFATKNKNAKTMAERIYPVGIQTFSDIINRGCVYVDKTDLIYKLTKKYKYVFLSRPRRFGKSLLSTTLHSYFAGEKDLFKGLAIEGLEKDWTEYPVLHFDLSTFKNCNLKDLQSKFNYKLSEYESIWGKNPESETPGDRFKNLIISAKEQTGKPVIIIIDEYDAPLLDVLHNEDRLAEIRTVIQEFYAPIKANDEYIRFTFITGITKFSQLSIFSAINNLSNISMDPEFAAICGITKEELTTTLSQDIELMAEHNGVSKEEMARLLQENYDGYHFTRNSPDIFNPFSLMRALASGEIEDYWFASGTSTYLINQMQRFKTDVTELDNVFAFSSSFDRPTEKMTDALPLLYQSGYLTIKGYDPLTKGYFLGIPNKEVRAGLMENLLPLYTNLSDGTSLGFAARFYQALVYGNIDKAMTLMKSYFASIPYPEGGKDVLADMQKNEYYYETVFYIMLSMMNIAVLTQVKSCRGRADAVMFSPHTIFVFEIKINKPAKEALAQIDEKGYMVPFEADERKLVKIGISFSTETRTIEDWEYRILDKTSTKPTLKKAYSVEEKRKEHGNAYLPWEKEADDILIKFYNEGKKIKEIAEIMERSRGAIYSRLKKLGIIN